MDSGNLGKERPMSVGVAPSIVRTWLRSQPRVASVPAWKYRTALLGLLVGVALLRIVFLAKWCRFDLSPDEAHYWDTETTKMVEMIKVVSSVVSGKKLAEGVHGDLLV